MKQFGKKFSLERRARMIAATVPRRHWFRAAILMSRVHGHLSAAFTGRRRGIVEAYIREDCLIELSRRGPFHVPIRVIGAELLEPAESERAGVVLCGTHVPWNNVMIRAAILSGHKPELVVTDPNSILLKDNEFLPTGLDDGVPAAAPGPGGLLRIRTVLRNKGIVACTLDQRAGGKSYPDLLVIAGRLGARAVTFSAELARDGVVDITFRNALHPYCESRQAIQENLQAILAEERRLLASLDGLDDSEVSIDALSQPDTLTVAPEQAAETPFPVVATTPVKATRQL
jgi:hypothetical protein